MEKVEGLFYPAVEPYTIDDDDDDDEDETKSLLLLQLFYFLDI